MTDANTPLATALKKLDFGHDAVLKRVDTSLRRHLAQARGAAAEPPLVVGLFGEWGSGKSNLLEAVGLKIEADEREAQKVRKANPGALVALNVVVRFNAWRFEREEHLLVPFLKVAQAALHKSLEAGVPEQVRERERLSDRVALLGELALTVAQQGGAAAVAALWTGVLALEAVQEGGTAIGKALKGVLGALAKRKKALEAARQPKTPVDALPSLYYDFQTYLQGVTGRNPKALKLFRQRLTQGGLGAVPELRHAWWKFWRMGQRSVTQPLTPTQDEQNAQEAELHVNLIFLVDDLDRCLPDKAVEVLEAIKLFLEVPGCVFVLALDEEVVERGIAHRYRDYALQGKAGMTPITGAEYLEKLVHLPVRLPRPTAEDAPRHLARRYGHVFADHEGEPTELAGQVAWLTPAVPRKYERMADMLALSRELVREQEPTTDLNWRGPKEPWLVVACVLQLFAPALFRHLRVAGADLLLELAGWRGRELVDATWQRARLQRQLRREAEPAELRRLMSRQRMAELVAEALHNRSGFDLLRLLAEVNRLQAEDASRLAPQHLTQLLALAQEAQQTLETGDASSVPHPEFADLEPSAIEGLQEAFRTGDAERLATWVQQQQPALQGRLLRDGWVNGWLLRNDGADWRGQPEKAEPVWRCLAPYLSQWAVLRLAAAWGVQVIQHAQGMGWVKELQPSIPQADELELLLTVPGPDPQLRLRLPAKPPRHNSVWWRRPAMQKVLFAGRDATAPLDVMQDEWGRYTDIQVGTVVQRLRWLPPGKFWMGSTPEEQKAAARDSDASWLQALRLRFQPIPDWFRRESPKHPVTLTQGFWLADTACTQALWLAVVGGKNPSRFKGDDELPVEQVSWDDVMAQFMPKLQALLPGDVEATLPTEAQWEYACRAGSQTPFSFGEQINPEQVNYDGTDPYNGGAKGEYREKTVAVKALPANAWGLYQMHGNVWEWCFDGLRTYSNAEVVDPLGAVGDGSRALRGGSWDGSDGNARSAYRRANDRGDRWSFYGFRLALRFKPSPGAKP